MASGDAFPSNLPGPPRTQINEQNIDTVNNLVEEKPNSSISLPTLFQSYSKHRGKIRC